MRFNVLLDDFIGHITRTCCKVSTCPQMSTPKLSTQLIEFLQHLAATPSFDALHQAAYRYLRGNRYQQVNVVNRYMSAQNVHFLARTGLAHQLAQTYRDLSPQHGFAILGNPDQVVLQIVDRMRCFSIAHTCIVRRLYSVSNRPGGCSATCTGRINLPDLMLKTARLKGEGFNPIYRQ